MSLDGLSGKDSSQGLRQQLLVGKTFFSAPEFLTCSAQSCAFVGAKIDENLYKIPMVDIKSINCFSASASLSSSPVKFVG
jgi:hypothetical protein